MTIGGLDADSDYQVQVRATNDEGDSEWSTAGSGNTNAQPQTPQAPAITLQLDVDSNVPWAPFASLRSPRASAPCGSVCARKRRETSGRLRISRSHSTPWPQRLQPERTTGGPHRPSSSCGGLRAR